MPSQHPRVAVTGHAAALLRELYEEHGRLLFHHSGGCCDGSSPMCFTAGEFRTGDADVHLGDLGVPGAEPVPVWMAKDQFAFWSHAHLTIDAVPGRCSGFSLESGKGQRFIVCSRMLTEEESAAWQAAG